MSINKEERDKFLVKLMNEKLYIPDFSTWEGFGKLWEFIKKYKRRQDFWKYVRDYFQDEELISIMDIVDPDIFANRVYEFLNKKE